MAGAGWTARLGQAGAAALLLAAIAPLAAVLALPLLFPSGAAWPRGAGSMLAATMLLAGGASALALLWGTAAAWLVEMCSFAGRRVFGLLLFLPFALPPYLHAYVWGDLADTVAIAGVRSMPGACLLMSFALYPYVYMFARASFARQSSSLQAASRLLGCTPWGAFFKVALPMARPALGIGALLVFMEAANDIAVAQDFGLGTLGYRVYDLWLNRGAGGSAALLASLLAAIGIALFWLESFMRRRQRQYESSLRHFGSASVHRLRGGRAALACCGCGALALLGFAVPALALAAKALASSAWRPARLADALADTLLLALLAGLASFAIGVALLWLRRRSRLAAVRLACVLPAGGYALPGVVYGMGCLLLAGALADGLFGLTGYSAHWLMHSSIGVLVLALACRYLVIPGGALERGLEAVSPRMDEVGRCAGKSRLAMLFQVWLPLLRPSLLAGGLLLAADIIKELPLTLLLRPLGTDPLAPLLYQYASDEDLGLAAPPALLLVMLTLTLLCLAYPMLMAESRRRFAA